MSRGVFWLCRVQCLAMDLRPEVRNSGVRTLFAVIVNQGPRLSPELWERCLWEMLFPLLRHAYRMSANSDKEEVGACYKHSLLCLGCFLNNMCLSRHGNIQQM